jgi:hypothetical protein
VLPAESGAPIALGRPEDFEGTLEPGQTRVFRFRGESTPGDFPEVAAMLCPDMPAVDVKVNWQAQLRSSDTGELVQMEMGMASTRTEDVRCEV